MRNRFIAVLGAAFALAVAASGSATAGVFDLSCLYSHSLADDPIVAPARPGAAHLHDFFGATTTNAYSNFDSLSALLGTGRTTCAEIVPGGKNHRDEAPSMRTNQSALWFPALHKGQEHIRPVGMHLYYRNDSGRPVEAFQPRFVMIAGPFSGPGVEGKLEWFCRSPGDAGKARWDRLNANCIGERKIHTMFSFPNCWDGRLDSPDHRSHVRYPVGGCPATHARKVPRLLVIVHYRLEDRLTPADLLADWHLATQRDGARQELREFHGDYMFAWDQRRLAQLVDECLNAPVDCKRNPPGAER